MMVARDTDVIILCGGLGTRLGATLGSLPKAMAPVGNRPFLEILIDGVTARGFRRFILCIGHGAGAIKAHFRGRAAGEIVFSEEATPLGTAGALKLCEPLRQSRTALVMNGDSWCDFDAASLLDFHVGVGALATLAVVPAAGRTDADFIDIAAGGAISRFSETAPDAGAPAISAGVYALGSDFWTLLPAGRFSSLEKEIFPALVGQGLFAWPAPAVLYDIGTPERLDALRRVFRG